MSAVKFSLTEEQAQAVMDGGLRFWFLEGRILKVSGPWQRRGGAYNGRKYKKVTSKQYPDCIVFCEAIKVNKFTVILRLPDGNKPKMRLQKVFVPEDVQEVVRGALFDHSNLELQEKYNNNEPFFSTVKNKEGEENVKRD